ncbi:OmpA family protein [Sphingomonas laterariae]|uniref:OmpA family protein n=1 Tax=Edaphosphingomonas laterariae TaxID=861865 RepID=A0A239E0U2_9SPHN|nr:OmpA family protein [Sphingomonas laterariae]SNS38227.1 OmpA family protein [Sphingomonas laterariae]
MIRASLARLPIALPFLTLATACATPSVLLLDGENGAKTGAVAVIDESDGSDRAVVSEPNTKASIGDGTVRQRPAEPSDRDRALVADLPTAPTSYTLYFLEDSTDLAPGSEAVLSALLAEVAARPGADVQIIGHTDRLGSGDDNDRLSMARAQEIRAALITRGLDPDATRASGRGERDPLVATEDGISEPRNRRVEVVVR